MTYTPSLCTLPFMASTGNPQFGVRLSPDVRERAEARAWYERDSLTAIVRSYVEEYARHCPAETLEQYRAHLAVRAARGTR